MATNKSPEQNGNSRSRIQSTPRGSKRSRDESQNQSSSNKNQKLAIFISNPAKLDYFSKQKNTYTKNKKDRKRPPILRRRTKNHYKNYTKLIFPRHHVHVYMKNSTQHDPSYTSIKLNTNVWNLKRKTITEYNITQSSVSSRKKGKHGLLGKAIL